MGNPSVAVIQGRPRTGSCRRPACNVISAIFRRVTQSPLCPSTTDIR